MQSRGRGKTRDAFGRCREKGPATSRGFRKTSYPIKIGKRDAEGNCGGLYERGGNEPERKLGKNPQRTPSGVGVPLAMVKTG